MGQRSLAEAKAEEASERGKRDNRGEEDGRMEAGVVVKGKAMVDAAEFKRMTPNLNDARRAQILPPLQHAMTRFNVDDTRLREAHFMAQVLHESGGFQFKRELASGRAYEGRRDLGNTRPGDGPRYKGRGWIQVTGRANYRVFGQKLGLDLEGNPVLAESDENAPLIAAAYWSSRSLNTFADEDDLLTITRRINGGLNGLADRRARLSLAKQVLSLDDPDVTDEDPEMPVKIVLKGVQLPFDGFCRDNTSWAPLRLLAGSLGVEIVETDGPTATLRKPGVNDYQAPLQIEGGRGFSPIRPVAQGVGLNVGFVNGVVTLD